MSYGEVPASGEVIACPPGKGDSSPLTGRNRLFLPARESQVCLHQCLHARVQLPTLSLSKS